MTRIMSMALCHWHRHYAAKVEMIKSLIEDAMSSKHLVLGQGEFNPLVKAHCERGYMTINIITKSPFNGIIHTRDFRNNSLCSVTGNASRNTTLRISAVAVRGEPSYCGVGAGNQDSDDEQRQVAIAVRTHRSIELSDDKYFLITCAQSSYFNTARKVRSRVRLSILHPDDPNKTPPTRLIMGNPYTFRAQLSDPDKEHRLFLKHCIAFSQLNATETLLLDDRGCSADSTIISPFNYSTPIGEPVDAAIRSMFKFPDVYRVHIQCDVVLCRQSIAAKCARKYSCSPREPRLKGFLNEEEHRTVDDGFGLPEDETTTNDSNQDEIHIVSATTAYVLETDQELLEFVKRAEECSEWRSNWLVGLVLILGALLAIMFIVNICLCTSLTCTCTKQDVLDKEDGSELADYDPYKIDWAANNTHLYGNSLPRHYHSNYNARSDYQEELDYNLGQQRPSSRYSSSAPSYNKPTGYHNYGYR